MSELSDEYEIVAIHSSSRESAGTIRISTRTGPPWQLLATLPSGEHEAHSGDDLHSCLLSLRRSLETKDILLCCQGARPDVFVSGIKRQMEGGCYGFTFDPESREVGEEVDILAPALASEVGTVEEQRRNIYKLAGLE
ncbi:hypothetical protein [Streptomyces iconiensis]|uniref:Uncharacterized protein n=1 Tax=Streptomyces iconiensis TaxID=1384038 RepID=A0ABT7A8G3_9ACTN|nr:hypothetical protein [Streptomyces iconiensis]MDJ1137625.1 hypothetical protein [Streptomyces iconiensis]